jgi:hypothetical protein
MKYILTIIIIFFAGLSGEKFNNTTITEITQDEFQKAVVYRDSIGHQYIECKLAVIPGGYTGESGTPLGGKFLIDVSGLDNGTLEYIIALRNYKLAEKQFKYNQ